MKNEKRLNYKDIILKRDYNISYHKNEKFIIGYKKITDNKTFIQKVFNLGFVQLVIINNRKINKENNEYFILEDSIYMTPEEIELEAAKNDKKMYEDIKRFNKKYKQEQLKTLKIEKNLIKTLKKNGVDLTKYEFAIKKIEEREKKLKNE